MPRHAKPGLTPKQVRFVEEYIVDHNGAAAARRAGYSEATAKAIAYQLLQRPDVREAVARAEEDDERLRGEQRRYVLNSLREVAERARQAMPVRDGKGKKVGVYRFDGATAVRALELLGKNEGLFSERLDLRVQGEVERVFESIRTLISPQSYADVVRALAQVAGIEVASQQGMDPPAAPGDRSSPVH